MACYYWKGGKQYASENDLVSDFLDSGEILSNAAIFSSEDIQTSVYNKVKLLNNPVAYNSGKYEKAEDFVSRPHPEIFSTIVKTKDIQRLTPEYIEQNRIRQYIIDNITTAKDNPTAVYNTNVLSELMQDPEISKYPESKVKSLLSEIENLIEIENKTKDLSILIHNILFDVINGDSINKAFKRHFKAVENFEELFGKDADEELWFNTISRIVNTISAKIESIGAPITQLRVVTHPESKLKVSGNIDLVAVDSTGTVHIFDIKTSKNSFINWDSAKVLSTDWSLAIKRQLLGQEVNIDDVQLWVVPIVVQGLENPSLITLDDFQNRTRDEPGLRSSGWVFNIADALIPRRIFVKRDPERLMKLKAKLLQVIPQYEIRTEVEDNNVDLIMENAEKRFQRDKVWRKYNKYSEIDDIPEGYIEVKPDDSSPEAKERSKEEFRKLIERYVEFVKSQENRGVAVLMDAIVSSLKTNQSIKTSRVSSKKDKAIQHLLEEYLNDDWQVLDIKESIPMGIILLRNKLNGTINIFNVSVNNALAGSDIDDLLYGELDVIKAMVFLNEFKKDILPSNAYKLGQIITFNPKSAESHTTPSHKALRLFKERMSKVNLSSEINIKDSDLLKIEDISLYNLITVFKSYDGKEKETIQRIANTLGDGHLDQIDREKLLETRKELLKAFPTYLNKTINPELNFDDPIEVIFALLQIAILSKEGVEPTGDFRNLTKDSIEFADFKSLFTSFYTKNVEQYDKVGNKIQGLIGGLAWSTPDWVQSKDLRQISGLMQTGNSVNRERIIKVNERIRPLTLDFYKAKNYGTLERMTWGESQSKYENLYYLENGKVTKDFKTKNPYKNDLENVLEDYERDYLKNILLIINQYLRGVSDEEVAKVDPNNLESVRKIKAFADAIDSGEYFEMPLIRREEMTKYKGAFKELGEKWNIFGMTKDNFDELLDSRELSPYDVSNIDASSMGFYEMYDVYGKQDRETKARMLEERPVNYYEYNLDTIAHRVAFNKIRKNTFDLIMPTINAYMWWIKLIGAKQNIDVSKQLEYVTNQIKLAIFNEPIIGDEQATIAKGLSFARQISSVAMLAFRPVLLAKELTVGVLRNLSAAGVNYAQDFGAKEMTEAYGKLITIDNKFTDEFNLIDKMNFFYGMANMDISTVPKKIQTDRWGVVKGLGRYMFMTSTYGDYYNRMAILIAKMLKDGSYKAHSLSESGALIYDPTKDDRFSYYLSEREKHKNSKGEYLPKKGDERYNTQRQRYLLTIAQLNKEGVVTEEKQLSESSLITKAYTQQERNSFKSYSDLMFGAYDKDWQAQAGSTLMGIAFMQFLNYWPNKMKHWFGRPVKGEDSTIGKVTQQEEEEDGIIHKLWWETKENPDGTIYREITRENTGDPVLAFKGTPQEGIFLSLAYTIQDIAKGNWKDVKDNKLRKDRVLFALADGVLIFIIMGIITAIFNNIVREKGRDSVSGELANFSRSVSQKVTNEYNVWDNTFGAINSEPLMLSWGVGVMDNMHDVFTGDKSIDRALSQSVGAFEFLKNIK